MNSRAGVEESKIHHAAVVEALLETLSQQRKS
jgi:hypothetical protein